MVAELFNRQFNVRPDVITRTPGRVNLIGEHTDYNGGMVLPALIEGTIDIAIGPSPTGFDMFYSDGYGLAPRGAVEDDDSSKNWWAYARGALAWARNQKNSHEGKNTISPIAIAFTSTIPAGSGLSSSAAMLVGICKSLREMGALELSDVEIALGAQQIENDHIGVPCGIMDQMAIAVGKPGMALALDTGTLAYKHTPLPPSHDFVIVHSGITRKLTDGRYKDRRLECEEAKRQMRVEALCTMCDAEFARLEGLPDILKRRARHAYTEHHRVLNAVKALKSGDMSWFGRLMQESHASYRGDFEASTPEIDSLVEGAIRHGAVGARLTGGGFGGCVVACVEKSQRLAFETALIDAFPRIRIIC